MGILDSILNFGSTAATNRANERIQDSINETNTANVNATNESNRQIAEATNKANVQMNEANNAANRELAELPLVTAAAAAAGLSPALIRRSI